MNRKVGFFFKLEPEWLQALKDEAAYQGVSAAALLRILIRRECTRRIVGRRKNSLMEGIDEIENV